MQNLIEYLRNQREYYQEKWETAQRDGDQQSMGYYLAKRMECDREIESLESGEDVA